MMWDGSSGDLFKVPSPYLPGLAVNSLSGYPVSGPS